MNLEAGTRVGRYEIESLIGAGGMGEVYRARDTELGRPVALKFLHAEVAADQQRMNRFIQEARAASALNHPNILTVHDIGQTEEGQRFFATEFVEGVTLRKRLQRGGMKLGEALEVAAQVAGALASAHAAGVVHRDIKPENIMLRRDGYAKVLDFGLAKLTGNPAPAVDTEAATQALVNTDPGTVMGTVAYMSPEQARGQEVDARTDLWSLGVVLYEMLTGHLPFGGTSTSHTIVSILDEEPPPLARYLPGAPEALQEVIADALTKDPDARFQTAKQFHAKLQRLKGRLQAGAPLDHSVAPGLTNASGEALDRTGASGDGGANAQPTIGVSRKTTARSGEAAATVPTVSSAEYAVKHLAGHKKIALFGLALLFVSIAAVAFAVYKFAGRDEAKGPAGQMKITRLTSTGQASDADISPDGKYVVHVKEEAGRRSLWLRQVETTSDTQIVPPTDDIITGSNFSRDGAYIYYLRGMPNATVGALYQVPLLGGAARKLSDDVRTRITLSPDGKRMAFGRVRAPGESFIVAAGADGTEERVVAVRKLPNAFGGTPAWSPDGKSIASAVLNIDAGGLYGTLVEIEVEGGAERRLTPERWSTVGAAAWLPDKSGLVFVATAEGTLEPQIWHVSYPGGEVRKVTNDLNSYTGVRLTADASALVTVQTEGETNIWAGPAGEAARARQITSGRANNGRNGIAWTPDGRIVYTAREGGVTHIWIMEADGTGARPLTARTRNNNQPSVTSDGRYIVFRSIRTGTWNVWRMDLDGGNVKQLTEGVNDNYPRPSPDGRWIVFTSNRAGVQNLWKVSIDGGEPVRLTEKITNNATVSPDGKLIACHYRQQANDPYRVALIPVEGGEPVRLLDIPQKFVGLPGLRWTPDGRALLYAETQGGVSNIWSLPVDGGTPKQLTDFKADEIFWFDISRDGRQLAASRGQITNDVVLIKDFR